MKKDEPEKKYIMKNDEQIKKQQWKMIKIKGKNETW